MSQSAYQDLKFAKVDLARLKRRGFPEAIYAKGKSVQQICKIASSLKVHRQPVLITKLTKKQGDTLQQQLPWLQFFPQAQMCAAPASSGQNRQFLNGSGSRGWKVLVMTAGTSDLPVAEEACVTLNCLGQPVKRLFDVGVAGVERLLAHKRLLTRAEVIVVVAGMDGALPAVAAGLTSAPVVAVPTSVGYGASFKGVAPLLTMLNSCSPGVALVNIDNGFGAGYLAAQILKRR